YFARWRDQPAASELSGQVNHYAGPTVELVSNALGCRVTVESDNVSPCVELAESALAALESFISTAGSERVMAREPVLTITIRRSESATELFVHEVKERDG